MPDRKLTVVKASELYVFVYDEDSKSTLLQTLGRYAADKSLSFSWYDAARLFDAIESATEADSQFLVSRSGIRDAT